MKTRSEFWANLRFVAVFAAAYLGFSTVAFAQYYIPSSSMRPTLEVGDRVLVNKFAYGWSRFSLPREVAELLPSGSDRILGRNPQRGDVIVFRRPDEPAILIKRVVGLPGDEIAMRDGRLIINGRPVDIEGAEEVLLDTVAGDMPAIRALEQLPSDRRPHATYDLGEQGAADNFGPYRVPQGCYFAMGDNRDNSADSRYWGCVPAENLVGKAISVDWTLAWTRPDPRGLRDSERLWRGL